MIDAILKLFGPGFVAGLALGGYALLWWDHRPADMPAVHWRARAPLSFIHFDWTAPQSLAADDAAALAAEAAWAKNFTTLH
ncbi:MAG TPA: hypothetical protein VJP88_09835, partial [Caulobacteraceae bacterium]|nr:hypothetical protein [Caulobacteraceae bacterium]